MLAQVPILTSFTPGSGPVGTSVTITGANFSTTPANNTVNFNGTTATVTASTATSITTSVPTGSTTGAITVTVAGLTGTSATNFTVPIDTTPPVVAADNTLATIAPNSSISVSANFTDASGIATNPAPRVFYRPIAGAAPNTFVSANMTLSTGSTYTATIPASAVTELGVEYKYLITDGAGLDNSTSQTLYKTHINHASGLAITSYPGSAGGTEQTSYRIISIPLILEDKTADGVFKDVIGGYDPTTWRMFRYNGTRFDELTGSTALVPGEGYWFITVTSSPLNTGAGTTVDVSSSSPFTITLKPGWNQIGNPYNFSISWADVIAANPTEATNLGGNSSKIRTYRGVAENVDVLKPLEGGFVKYVGTASTTIVIPVAKNASIQGRIASQDLTSNSLDQPSWERFFTLKNGSDEYSLGGFGMHPEAKEDFDYHDDFNSPRFFNYLEVKFPKKYVGMTYTKDVVPTTENYSWKFNVETNLKDPATFIQWNASDFNTTRNIFLLDVALHKITDMSVQSSYQFDQFVSKEFKVILGQEEYVKQELIPDRVVLHDPYPNPFASEAIISYALPSGVKDTGAEVEIFNSQGARVSRVATQESGPGFWSWNAEGQASGLYIVRIKAANQSVTKKILKR